MIFVTHLKSVFSENDSYKKKAKKPEFLKIKKGDETDIYKMKKILVKRKIYIDRKRRRKIHSKFRIK